MEEMKNLFHFFIGPAEPTAANPRKVVEVHT
jgi:hypothetical protein